MPVLDKGFNQVVRYMGGLVKHTLTTSDYADFDAMKLDYERTGSIKINVLHSEGTIFGSPELNWLFRAWHDQCHLLSGGDFTQAGEARAADYMMFTMQRTIPNLTNEEYRRYCRIIDAEVNGQGKYYIKHGDFPTDQYQMVKHYLDTDGEVL